MHLAAKGLFLMGLTANTAFRRACWMRCFRPRRNSSYPSGVADACSMDGGLFIGVWRIAVCVHYKARCPQSQSLAPLKNISFRPRHLPGLIFRLHPPAVLLLKVARATLPDNQRAPLSQENNALDSETGRAGPLELASFHQFNY